MNLKKHLEGRDLGSLYQDLKPWAEGQTLGYPDDGVGRQILKDTGYDDNAMNLTFLYHTVAVMLLDHLLKYYDT